MPWSIILRLRVDKFARTSHSAKFKSGEVLGSDACMMTINDILFVRAHKLQMGFVAACRPRGREAID